ncbi:MAG: LPXTG cell wall anchor domain-containing protein [Anaerovoracaceae bacterium]
MNKKIKMAGDKLLVIMLSLLIMLSAGQTVYGETKNEVWVNGVNIAAESDNTVDCGSGTAVYNNKANTLTLNNAKITTVNKAGHGIENKRDEDFEIILNGSNSIDISRNTGVFAYTDSNMTFSGGGSLDIKSKQNISNHKNVTFDNVNITATGSNDGSIVSDGNVVIKNGSDIKCSGTYFGFNVIGDITIAKSNVTGSASLDKMNAFCIIGKITIDQKSKVTATSDNPSLFSKGDMNISDSTIKATSTADYGIWSKTNLAISGDSEVISQGQGGSIGAETSFKIAPPPNKSVEVFIGKNSSSITQLGGSPFANEKDLKALNVSVNPFFHSKIHKHTPAASWTKNGTSHWHECIANDGKKMDLASHTFGEWVIDTPATETTKGSKHRYCTVCSQRETAEIPVLPHKHIPAAEWTKNETSHWHECIANDGKKMDLAFHTFGEWVIDTPTTETTKGSKHRDCTVCSQRETVEIPVLPHKHIPAEAWTKNETSHWHECIANDGKKMDLASHTFGEWVIDTPATETTKGSKHRDCTVCGQKETVEIAYTGETPVNPSSPKTGDTSNTFLYLGLILLSGCVAGFNLKKKKALNK